MQDVDDIPEEELGVELDHAIDRKIDTKDALYTVRDVYGRLDSAADNEIPVGETMAIREMQEDAQDVIDTLEAEVDAIGNRVGAIRERLYG